MFEKAEAEYETLTSKKRIVNNDKAKIEKVFPAFVKRMGGVASVGQEYFGESSTQAVRHCQAVLQVGQCR